MLQEAMQVMKRPLDIRLLTIDLRFSFPLASSFGEVWVTVWWNLSEF